MKGEKFYQFIGFIKNNTRYFADKNCPKCFGRGYKGKNVIHNTLIACNCLKTTNLPINWAILKKKGASEGVRIWEWHKNYPRG